MAGVRVAGFVVLRRGGRRVGTGLEGRDKECLLARDAPVRAGSPGVVATGYVVPSHTQRSNEMAAKLEKAIKRELDLDGETYTLTISPEGVRIVPKGRRKGHEITWRTIISGDAELTQQLKISLDAMTDSEEGAGR